MKNALIKLANHLDNKGRHKEADYLDAIIKKATDEDGKPAVDTRQVADWIVGGTPITGEDADTSVDELAELLNKEEHLATAKAILDYFSKMNELYLEKPLSEDSMKAYMDPEDAFDPSKEAEEQDVQELYEIPSGRLADY
jgi:hypothetical protein